MITLPAVVLGLMIALLIGAIYHLVRGGGGWRLLLYLGLSIIGFALAELIGVWRGWNLFMVGSLDLGIGILGSVLFLVAGDWLSRIETKRESGV